MLKYALLGILQGLTEFLPVSSSGHLVIFQKLLGVAEEGVVISVVLHAGTLFALAIFFIRDLLAILRHVRLLLFILAVTLITGSIGIAGKDFFEGLFGSPRLVAFALIFTGLVLLVTKRSCAGTREKPGFKDALVLGLAQATSIIPGLSRSGMTISTLLFRKFAPETSFKLSFLAAIPAISGALLLEAGKVDLALKAHAPELLIGFIFSFLTGLISLQVLKSILRKEKFYLFGFYCFFLAIITLIFLR
ncbi:MAG: undecaprenyl-diphosphate phosphatase [Candidatus Omnitrophica bacterium]|nr:undecaprenyl-diphosphate phosphatase [Candidatus Omnitrophota bacterium]